MNDLIQDIAFAWRNALKQPATALLIVVTLALGIGANSAMFSVAWHVLAAPLPYADGDRLVRLEQNEAGTGLENRFWSWPTFADFQAENTVFTDMVSYFQEEYPLHGHGSPHLALTGVVNWKFFEVLDIGTELGRGFIAADDQPGAASVMLLSREFWLREFGGSPDVVGTVLEMMARSYTVIGVLSDMPAWPRANEVWITNAGDAVMSDERVVDDRGIAGLIHQVVGKLKPGLDLQAASRDAARIVGQLAAAYPDAYGGDKGYSVDLHFLKEELVGEAAPSFLLLLALALLVLLIASANVANLNLARLAARGQELAVREAVGAGPGRIRRQLFTESLLFALAGGLLGLAIAYLCLGLLVDFAAGYTPLAGVVGLDGPVLLFTLLVACLTGLLSGMAMTHGRRDINSALKEGGDKATASAGARPHGHALLILQYSLAFVMLATTALIVISLARLNGEDPGYEVDRILTGGTLLDLTPGLEEDPWENRDFVMGLLDDIEAMPGVASAAAAGFPVLRDMGYPPSSVKIEGRADGASSRGSSTLFAIVSEDYFEVMDIPLLKGRPFQETDDENADIVLIVNEAFERRHFPAGDAIGQRVTLSNGFSWHTIVGVVADARSRGLDSLEGPMVYNNYRAGPTTLLNLYIRAEGALDGLGEAVNRRFGELAPQVPLPRFEPMSERRVQWLAPTRLRAWLIGLFGLLALTVTLSGVVGVVSHQISRRRREIGIHMAVGATPSDIVRSFMIGGMKAFIPGLLLGIVLMLAGAPLLQTVLYETRAVDPGVYLLAAIVLAGAVLAAIYQPARRAAGMQPSRVLRAE